MSEFQTTSFTICWHYIIWKCDAYIVYHNVLFHLLSKHWISRLIDNEVNNNKKLEQLERLRSEDSPCRPMCTHTIDSL